MPHRFKGGTLVGLLEGVRLRNPGHQNDGKHNNVFFSESEEIARPR
jgi:hypothetical protein